MPASIQAVPDQVNAFPINNTVQFKHYFDGDEVFSRLRPYYNGNQYRFEVPVGKFDSLRRFLLDHGYKLTIVDRPEEFYVIVPQYSEHPDGIFKQSVRHECADGYHCFLMTDRESVDAMLVRGAERLTSTPLALQPGTLTDFAPLSA
jgi:hypothetical protein